MKHRRSISLAGVALVLGTAIGAGAMYARAPSYAFGLGERDRAWADYGATRASYLARDPTDAESTPRYMTVAMENHAAYKRLVGLGELVEFRYDPQLFEAAQEFIHSRHIDDLRGGQGMDGGQWPVGLITVHRAHAAIMDRCPGVERRTVLPEAVAD